jgi:hypothetical protein
MRAGSKVAVTPLGSPITEKVMVEENPFNHGPETLTSVLAPILTVAVALEIGLTGVEFAARTVTLRARVFVAPPPVAATVTVAGPVAAPVVAVSVKVLLPLPGDAMLAGEKAAVTPLGNPVADNATPALKFCAAIVSVTLVWPPAVKLALVVFDVRARAGAGAVTVKLIATVFVTPPPVPVTVSEALPTVALDAAVSVSVVLPLLGEVMLAGENTAVTPFGNPLTESATVEVNAPTTPVVSVKAFVLPATTLPLVALAASVNEGSATVKLMA